MGVCTRENLVKVLGKTPWLFLALSLCGWVIFVIAFGLTNHSPQLVDWLGYELKRRTHTLFVAFWLFCFIGPFLHISAIVHLLLRRWYTGVILYVLTAAYLLCGGAVVMTENILNKLTLDFLSETQPLWGYVQAETAGCVISFLALVVFMSLWPLLSVRPLPSSLLTLRFTSGITHIESGTSKTETATGHVFSVTKSSTAPENGDAKEREKTALLPEKE